MQREPSNQRLSLIPTQWSIVRQANHGSPEEAKVARKQLLDRYGDAVQRFLGKVLHDPDAADEVFQEFALQLVQGKLRGADPQRGRFRYFLKGTLFHLIADFRSQQRDWPRPLPPDVAALLAANPDEIQSDRLFAESWSDELLARAWSDLAAFESETGHPFHAVLRFRADHPEMKSPQLAEALGAQLGKPLTAIGVRQTLHRAREKFAVLLLDEVIHSLENPEPREVEEELAELGLLEYCRPALEQRLLNV
jgi:DNA-directed RNA polymerase specialized sigma24 family protein